MSNQSVTDCNSTFLDSDNSPTSNYGHNENFTFTICPSGADSIIMSFTSFCTELNLDVLRFFDGPDTLSPMIGIPYSGNAIIPPPIIATSGCLTVHFSSDASVNCTGWDAAWVTVINTPSNPLFSAIPAQACNISSLILTLDQSVVCSSLMASNFNIFGPNAQNVTTITPIMCNNNATNTIQIDFIPGANQNGNYQLQLDATFTDDCGNLWPLTAFGDFDVDGCPITAEITSTDDNDTICLGDCTNLNATAWDGNGDYTYVWNNGLASNSGPHPICPIVTTTYWVTVTDTTNAPAGYDTLTIYVIQPVSMPNDTTVCQTTPTFDLDANPNVGYWSGPCFGNDTAIGIFHPFWCGTGVKTVTFNYYGCQSTMDITINPNNFWASNYLVCPGSPFFNFSNNNPGGTYSGTGITDSIAGTFDPTTAGPGSHQITYSNPPCTDRKRWVTVGNVTMPPDDTICSNSGLYEPAISPHGGVWTYPSNPAAITNWYWCRFNPITAGPGTHSLIYTTGNCIDTFKITVFDVEAGANILKCVDNAPFNLTGASPPGGVWSGFGITDPILGTFDPGANGGLNFDSWVYYTRNGCYDSLRIYNRKTVINQNPLPSVCDYNGGYSLNYSNTGRTPWSGTWSGTGVTNTSSNGTFSPIVSGVGTFTLYYEVNTCIDSTVITVLPNPNLQDTTVCIAQSLFTLPSDLSGGTWSGTGIVNPINGSFLPSSAGVGVHNIQYITLDNCYYDMDITVTAMPTVTIGNLPNSWCLADTNFILSFSPNNGNWTGTTQDSIFNPLQMGSGFFNIGYSIGTGECLVNASTSISIDDTLQVSTYFTDTTICLGDFVRIGANGSGGNELNYIFSWDNNIGNSQENVIQTDTTITYQITLNDGCSQESFAYSTIHVQQDFEISFDTSSIRCFDEFGMAKAIIDPPGIYSYSWSTNPINTTDSIYAKAGHYYEIKVTDINGCEKSESIEIPSYENLIADFIVSPNDACVDLINSDVYIIDQTSGALTGEWNFGDGETKDFTSFENIIHSYRDTGTYTIILKVENEGDCIETKILDICVLPKSLVVAPTAFSPNNDHHNDRYRIKTIGVSEIEFTVFNRWGELIYQADNLEEGWDGYYKGQLMPISTYTWQITFHSLETGNTQIETGNFQLVK